MNAPERRAVLPRVLVAAALLHPLAFLAVAIARLGHPFELEWMEGGVLVQVHRLLAGQPMYAAPTLDYIAFNYTPLYFWVGSLAARVLGDGFAPLRLVSLLAALGSFALLFALARRETKSVAAGLLAVSLFAATYRLGGAWLDIARMDSLFLMLLLAGFLAYRALPGARGAASAGALFALAFLAKQPALLVAVPLALHALLTDRRRFLAFAGTLAALVAASTLALDRASGGWFSYYVFAVALGHRPEVGLAARFWGDDLASHVAIAGLLGAWFLVSAGAMRSFHFALAAGLAGASWWLRSFRGSYDNTLLTAFAAVALLAALGWHDLRARLAPGPARFVHLALLVQVALLAWDPLAQIPTRADREAGERLVAHIRSVPGPVLVPSHPWLAERAGKAGSFHEMALDDVTGRRHGAVEDSLAAGLARALADHRWSAIVLDTRDWLADDAAPYYEPRLRAFSSDTVFWSRTGMLTRPETVLFPKP